MPMNLQPIKLTPITKIHTKTRTSIRWILNSRNYNSETTIFRLRASLKPFIIAHRKCDCCEKNIKATHLFDHASDPLEFHIPEFKYTSPKIHIMEPIVI